MEWFEDLLHGGRYLIGMTSNWLLHARRGYGARDTAVGDYDEAIRLDPRYASAFNNRGSVWLSTGKYDHAADDYDEAIRLNPQCASAYTNRGFIHYYRGLFALAAEDFSMSLRLNPTDTYLAVAIFYLFQNRPRWRADAVRNAGCEKHRNCASSGPNEMRAAAA